MEQTREGLQKLGAETPSLSPGSADASFIIPRELFENELGAFAKELLLLNRIVRDIGEAVTGNAEAVQLETLSSSIPTVAIAANVGVIWVLAKIVDKFLESWERVERIRKARAELAELGIRKSALDELTDQRKATGNGVVEESVQLALKTYDQDHGRKNELQVALKQDARRLFGRIERGLIIQFRVEPQADAAEEDERVLASLGQISCKLKFPAISSEPILLANGEIQEDEENIGSESIPGVKSPSKTGAGKSKSASKSQGQ